MPDRAGLVLIDKPSGITSHDAVMIFRRAGREKKTGHTGTLDPLATGLLVLCVGKATRLQSFLTGLPKTYTGTIRFGWATDTYDAEGTPTGEPREVEVDPDLLTRTIEERFLGAIEQVPPVFSAKKVDGERAYDLARKGKPPVLEPRKVRVARFSIDRVDGGLAEFTVECSAGTYVRSLAHDLGQAIGTPAHLASLRRTAIGSFGVDDAVTVDALRELGPEALFASPHFVPMSRVELPLESVHIDPMQERRVVAGQSLVLARSVAPLAHAQQVALVNLEEELVGIGEAIELSTAGETITVQPRVVLR